MPNVIMYISYIYQIIAATDSYSTMRPYKTKLVVFHRRGVLVLKITTTTTTTWCTDMHTYLTWIVAIKIIKSVDV